ncbi:anti-sigma-W factor RsiW [Bacillus safensis]|uniref:anti-sigma-W factor RsiW n=1 Tax=Bacillus safensis TaxID=561879 RepID=UPI002DD42C11|nr:anti-sigma-W factor RsiW [Bacillus safensis]MEC4586478.1 anti-sigma-W factor RsiW [Bacillus safensis]MEC4628613.1 anti-sigma-W factor RsiW [Bacillus safensis]
MSCQDRIVQLMHQYLDGDIEPQDEKELKSHLQSCEECRTHFQQIEKSIALVQSTSHIEAPSDFTAKVMAGLPKEKKRVSVQRWIKAHPLMVAAALFIILMGGSLFTSWNTDHNFSVSKQPNLVVENDTVTVPKGETVKGDITVKNGKLIVEGKVDGNVTVVNGEQLTASAGQVTGQINEINEVFDWIWYKMKSTAQNVMRVIGPEEQK